MKTGTTITLKILSIIALLSFAFTFVMSFFAYDFELKEPDYYWEAVGPYFKLPTLADLSVNIVMLFCAVIFFLYTFNLNKKLNANNIIAFLFLFGAIEYTTMPWLTLGYSMNDVLHNFKDLLNSLGESGFWDEIRTFLSWCFIPVSVIFLLIAAWFAHKDKCLHSKSALSVIMVGIVVIMAISIIEAIDVAYWDGDILFPTRYKIEYAISYLRWIPLCIAAIIILFSNKKRNKQIKGKDKESFEEVYDELYEKGWLTKEEYNKKIQADTNE